MNDTQLKTIEQIRTFLRGSEAVSFSIQTTRDRYAWIESVLIRLKYTKIAKSGLHSCIRLHPRNRPPLFSGSDRTYLPNGISRYLPRFFQSVICL